MPLAFARSPIAAAVSRAEHALRDRDGLLWAVADVALTGAAVTALAVFLFVSDARRVERRAPQEAWAPT